MKKYLSYLVAAMLLIVIMGACESRSRVIPRDRLAKIYAEMFIADEWLKAHPSARRTADTTLFYEPIFRKYGYSVKDYSVTVDEYLKDPERFSKVVEKAALILEERQKQAEDLKELTDKILAANARITGYTAKDFSTDSSRWKSEAILWQSTKDSIQMDTVAIDTLIIKTDTLVNNGLSEKIQLLP